MLDLNLLRKNPELIKKDLKKRKDKEKLPWVDKIIKLDKIYRSLKLKSEKLRHKRNVISLKINELQKQNKDISKQIKKIKELPKKIKQLEQKQKEIKQKINFYLLRLPNILHSSVPYGKDETHNKVIKKWGKIKKFNFNLKTHSDIIEELKIGDFKKAAQVSGTGFYYLTGKLAQLNQALMQFAIDFLLKKNFKLIIPPIMLARKAYEGATDLADFENVMYKIENENLYLIATSEHPIAAFLMNETIKEQNLPLKFCGLSPCFRKEIGSHGVDTRGLFRTHQFWKIEQFIFCKPENSWQYHEELQKNSEKLYQLLKIPYRVVNICTGDIGTIAAKKYDIEAWFPRQNKYAEVGSNSNCTDYQARRLNIKLLRKNGKKEFLHTLNNTAIATSRAIVTILENYQQKDGSIKIPAVLQKYLPFKKIQKE